MKHSHPERRWLQLGVTGHRFLARPERVEAGVNAALADMVRRFPGRPLHACSSLAEGSDRLIARLALRRRGASLVAVLPFPIAEYEQDFGSPESTAAFRELLGRAAAVIELPGAGGRPEAYAECGRYVVERCDVLVAVWDGLEAQGRGGTAEAVGLARSLGKPVAWVHAGNRRPGTEDPLDLGMEQGRYEYLE